MGYPEKQYHRQETAKEYTKLYTLDETDGVIVKQEDGLLGYISAGQFATTGSNAFTANQFISGNITITGDITAHNFITASTEYYTGSTLHGSHIEDTHTFTGSVFITGSLSVSGSFTSNLSQNNLFFGDSNNRSVATHYSQTPFNYRLYSQIESSTPITNTTNSGSLLGNGIGTLSVPANSFQIGDSFQAVMHGTISSRDSKGFTIDVKSDGIILASTGEIDTVDLYPEITHWTLNLNFVIRGIGSAGAAQILTMGNFIFNRETTDPKLYGRNFHYINSSSFDTTIDNTLYITGQWTKGTIGTQESINSDMFNLTKIF